MDIQCLSPEFVICKLPSLDSVDFSGNFVFLSKTDDEISLVCETEFIPPNTSMVERGFIAFKICGQLDFSLVGIIARISAVLTEGRISVFVVSTYNTDYVLVKSAERSRTVALLREAGYHVFE
jgi:hypothetical protein